MLRTELIRPLPELLREHADRHGDKPAFRDARRSVTYAELERRTWRLGGHLGLWLQPGDRAAILLGNRVETVESYLAVVRAGAVGVPINPRVTEAELDYLLEDSGARVVITDEAHLDVLGGLLRDRPQVRVVVVEEPGAPSSVPPTAARFAVLAETEPETPAWDDLGLDDVAWMLYTSGTTGKPKGVLSTQRNCLWSVAACYVPIPGLTADDRVLWPLPLFHSLAHIVCVLGVTAVGASARLVDGFSVNEVLTALEEERSTFLAGVPTMYHHLIRAARERGFRAPGLRVGLVGGAITTAALRRAFEDTFGVPLLDAYGSTETCGSIAINWPTGTRVEGSCGLPVPGLGVRLVSPDTGLDVAAGEEGEVWVRGPSVMVGYHNQPEATEAALRDGWYHTGDLARRDEAGYLAVTGRISELIIRGGENIHPAEVEEVLRAVPGVADVAVTGKPHDVLGEVPVAFVVPGPGGLDPEAASTACRQRLPHHKIPEELYEIARVPRTASGKVTRHALLDLPARLRAVSGSHFESLFRTDWAPLPSVSAAPARAGRWVLIGDEPLDRVVPDGGGEPIPSYPDLAGLRTAVAAGNPAPEVAVLPVPDPGPGALPDVAVAVAERLAGLTAVRAGGELLPAGTVLAVVTHRAVGADPDDEVDAAHAAAIGLVRSLRAVHSGRVVLVDLDGTAESRAVLPAVVAAGEPEVAVRAGIALVPRISGVPAGALPATTFDPEGAVLVTGADGAAAAAVARHLVVGHGVRHLLLLCDRDAADGAAADLRADLTDLGARAVFVACDPADRSELAAALGRAERPLSTVVHTLGRSGAAPDDLRGVVAAAVNLGELTEGDDAAGFLALLGADGLPGSAEPGVAAAVLGALTHRWRARGGSASVLALAAWEEAEPTVPGVRALSAQRALAAFDAACAVPAASLAAFAFDATASLSGAVAAPLRGLAGTGTLDPGTAGGTDGEDTTTERAGAEAGLADGWRARLRETPEAARDQLLVELVLAEAARLHGADRAAPDRAFKDMGLTSMTAVQLAERLSDRTGVRLPATCAFDHPTPAALARHLRGRLLGRRAAPVVDAAGGRTDEPVAIIGMACRLPGGVRSPADLWRLVVAGTDAITAFPDDRGWDLARLYDPEPGRPGRTYVATGGFLHDAAGFDAEFFGISPREALAMDPQQRLLLETSWEVFEQAGIDPTSVRGDRVGVFTGVMHHDYATGSGRPPAEVEGYLGTGVAGSVASGRVAYTLGLHGPAITVDTACSSSLVAVHLAGRALRDGECSLAIAGGVAVMATPAVFLEFSRQRGLAPDGRCKAFADAADGTAWSEGAAVLLLERLSDARRNGHEVLAVIRGSAINQDGASNGLSAPSGPAQERVIRSALSAAGLSAADVDLVEAHGTGTSLGDPIEAGALLAAYGQRPADRPLRLGSLKSNIGHTQAAAGVAGVIKAVEAIRNGLMPKTLHVDRPSSHVDWSEGAVELLTEAQPWPDGNGLRRAGVSSFGISGTNAHVIIEQAPDATSTAPAADPEPVAHPVPLVLGARSPKALRDQAGRLAAFLAATDRRVVDIGYSSATTRAALEYRAVVVARTHDEAVDGLSAFAAGDQAPGVVIDEPTTGRTALLFTGQGSQRLGMGRELHERFPVFRDAFDDACDALDPHLPRPLREVVFGADGKALEATAFTQPALFALEVALYRLVTSWGVRPDFLAGHSIGELAAAHVAGVWSLADAAELVAARGGLMQRLPAGGAMVAVAASPSEVTPLLGPGVDLAAVNGPRAVVLSGDRDAVLAAAAVLAEQGHKTKRLAVSHAFHSARVEPMLAEFRAVAAGLDPAEPTIPIVSTATGVRAAVEQLHSPDYWAAHARGTVRFADAVRELSALGVDTFLELGPDGVLSAAGPASAGGRAAFVPVLRAGRAEPETALAALGRLYARGKPADLAAAFTGTGARRVELPTYPFQRERFWLTLDDPARADGADHPLLDTLVELPHDEVLLGARLTPAALELPDRHRFGTAAVLPGAALVDVLAWIGQRLGAPDVERLVLTDTVALAPGGTEIQVRIGPAGDEGRRAVAVHAREHGQRPWREHAIGAIVPADPARRPSDVGAWPPPGAQQLDPEHLPADDPAVEVRAVWLTSDGDVHAEVGLTGDAPDDPERSDPGIRPELLDAVLLPLVAAGRVDADLVAAAWSGVRLHAAGARELRVRLTPLDGDAVAVAGVDLEGRPVLDAERVELRPGRAPVRADATDEHSSVLEVAWVPAPGAERSAPDWAYASDLRPDATTTPPVVVLEVDAEIGSDTLPERTRRIGARLLGFLQDWLAGHDHDRTELVVAVRVDDPAQEALGGLVRSVQSEHPGRIRLLETDRVDAAAVAALLGVAPDEPRVRVLDGRAEVARLRAATLPAPRARSPLVGGTVLLTGASGGIGPLLAGHLVRVHEVAELVLVSRSGVEDPWVDELRDAGARIRVVAADVADRATLADVVTAVADRLVAVVHAAGVVDDGLVTALDPERLGRVLRPKVDGAWHLHELTAGLDLRAFVLFSSAAAVLGSPGQANYAAGNAFLDALARHRHRLGLPALSLSWGLWAAERGMAGRLGPADLARIAATGTLPLSAEQGLDLFDRALAVRQGALVPIRFDPTRLRSAEVVPALLRLVVPEPRRRAATGAGKRRSRADRTLLELVRTTAAAVLGHPGTAPVDPDRPFRDLGFDSLTAVELSNRLVAETGVALPPTLVYDHPTPRELAHHLERELTGDPARADGPAEVAAVRADEPIAIVGMACRFPGGVRSPEDLWQLLERGGDAIGPMPEDRGWDIDSVFDPEPGLPDRTYVRSGGFLDDMADFDAGLFRISPHEALAMDPQQRHLLEVSWEALERAGLNPTGLAGSATGVFVGTHGQDYATRVAGAVDPGFAVTGSIASVLSGRVSYTLGLEGPAVTVDTACSSSSVAVHLAVRALRDGECTLALAGGVSVMTEPDGFVAFSRQRGLAADGRCKSFADDADGFGMSEGVGVLVLQRLSDARREGRRVLAVVRGSAVNQDGASNGLTAPNGAAQRRVMEAALANAGLSAADIDLLEAHGTGTPLGDPIEAQALFDVHRDRPADRPLLLGSVKSNIGHTQAAAGVAGVIKVVQSMVHGAMPRTLHVNAPSSRVDWSAGTVRLLTGTVDWPAGERPRRAGVSSFGVSGTNAHLVIEQPPEGGDTASGTPEERPVPWVLGARSPQALRDQAGRLAAALDERPDTDARDVGFTLGRRAALEHRAVLVPGSTADGLRTLRALAGGDEPREAVVGRADVDGRLVFVFPGQGAQWAGMGVRLLDTSPVFARAFDECAAALAPHLDWSPVDVLRQRAGAPDLDRVDVVQPVSFAVMVALAALWRSHGVHPDAVVGHSQGEIAAACVAGALSLEDAARVVAVRSAHIAARLAGHGGMLSLAAGPDDVEVRMRPWGDRVEVAAVNGPRSAVVAGDPAALEELRAASEADGVRARMVPVDYASHTSHVERIADELPELLAGLRPRPAEVPLYSTVDGAWLDTSAMDGDYWYRNLRGQVRFADAVQALLEEGHRAFVEISPHPVLAMSVQDVVDERAGGAAVVTGTLRRDDGGLDRFLTSVGELHARGVPVDFSPAHTGKLIDLPTYAFQHRRYWPEASAGEARPGDLAAAGVTGVAHPLLGVRAELPDSGGVLFTGRVSLADRPWLADHVVAGTVLLPATALVELALRVGAETGCEAVEELVVEAPLPLTADTPVDLRVVVGGPESGRRSLVVHSRAAGVPADAPWTRHATGSLSAASAPAAEAPGEWPPAGAEPVDVSGFYAARAESGYGFGPAFRGLRAAWRRGDEVFAEVALPDPAPHDADRFRVHPALLDAALHGAALGALPGAGAGEVLLPFAWSGVTLRPGGGRVLRVRSAPKGPDGIALAIADGSGRPLGAVESFVLRAVPAERIAGPDVVHDALYRVDWVDLRLKAEQVDVLTVLGDPTRARAGGFRSVPDPAALVAAVAAGERAPGAVLADLTGTGAAGGPEGARAAAVRALDLVRTWIDEPALAATRLVLLTAGAVAAEHTDSADPAGAAVWGLVRTAQSEHPDRVVLIDTDGHVDSRRALPSAVAAGEPQIALREGAARVPRLARVTAGDRLSPPEGAPAWRLEPVDAATLGGLALVPQPDVLGPLAEGRVLVEVRAAGLNFRDALIALRMYPEHADLGSEAAGTVLRVGPGVTGFAPGDRVMGMFTGAFGSHAVTDHRLLAKIPRGWSFTTAASVPIVFLTAYYALRDLADLRPGERVLVHAAAGGVGMAAVQLARHWGAEVFGTASPAKWDRLADRGPTGDHLASSRTPEFEKAFDRVTGGEGLDVVLNALTGEFVDSSLALLRAGGRFVELGKTDLRDPEEVARRRPGVRYRAFDLGRDAGPDRIREMLAELLALFDAGVLTPLPVAVWDLRRAKDAFRHMGAARHVGKVVLTIPRALDPRGTVLVSGAGLIGGMVARRLVAEHGVRRLVLASRRGTADPGTTALAADLRVLGAAARVVACDLADRDAVAALLAGIPAEHPLTAVVHTAGVLDDGVIGSLTPSRIDRVFRPKVDAAWHLHELTAEADLAAFVVFSSGAGVFGVPGQANYAAANAFLDALARHRRALGLPATALAWGLWARTSAMTGGLGTVDRDRSRLGGTVPLTDEEGMALFDRALTLDDAALVPTRLDLGAVRERAAVEGVPPLLRGLVEPVRVPDRPAATATAEQDRRPLAESLAELSGPERTGVLVDLVRTQAAIVLGQDDGEPMGPDDGFFDVVGFSSLLAVELRNRLAKAVGLRLPAALLFNHPTPALVAEFLAERLDRSAP